MRGRVAWDGACADCATTSIRPASGGEERNTPAVVAKHSKSRLRFGEGEADSNAEDFKASGAKWVSIQAVPVLFGVSHTAIEAESAADADKTSGG